MYSLGAALVAFSSWALFRAIRSPRQKAPWGLYGALTLLLLYTHYYALFSVAAQALFLVGASGLSYDDAARNALALTIMPPVAGLSEEGYPVTL